MQVHGTTREMIQTSHLRCRFHTVSLVHMRESEILSSRFRDKTYALCIKKNDIGRFKSRQCIPMSMSSNSSEDERPMVVEFVSSDGSRISASGKPGQIIADIAHKNHFEIDLGCCTGNCGVCEVEVRKYETLDEMQDEPPSIVVRSCVTPLPPGYSKIEVSELVDDIWALDGFDT